MWHAWGTTGYLADRVVMLTRQLNEARAEIEHLKRLVPPEVERSGGGVSQGSWSVFAEKVVKERDEALAEVERLRELLERALESLHKIGNDLIPDRALAARDALEQIDAKVKKASVCGLCLHERL